MFQLHNLRSDVQHWGVSKFSLEIVGRFDIYAQDFIEETIKSAFDIEYKNLFLGSLVGDIKIREFILSAEKNHAEGNWKDSVHKTAVAFAYGKREFLKKINLFRGFWTPPTMSALAPWDAETKKIETLRESVEVLAMNLNFEKYQEFQDKTPTVLVFGEENYDIQEIGEIEYNKENASFCINFAIDAILKWNL